MASSQNIDSTKIRIEKMLSRGVMTAGNPVWEAIQKTAKDALTGKRFQTPIKSRLFLVVEPLSGGRG